jgi:predicted nucleotidyltransferase
MIQLYQKVTQLKVLANFFNHPTEDFYLRELARLLKMSPMTVKRALDVLVKDKMIVREEKKNQILYHANMESLAYRYAKVSYNLTWLEKKGIVEYLQDQNPGISAIVLYGSFAKGENDRHSDLDLLVISSVKKVDTFKIREKLNIEVNILDFTGPQWTKQAKTNRAFYLDIITEGIVLYGTRPVVE